MKDKSMTPAKSADKQRIERLRKSLFIEDKDKENSWLISHKDIEFTKGQKTNQIWSN